MWPRKMIDLAWSDLAFGTTKCFRPGDRAGYLRRLETQWNGPEQALVCLSVRTGFDLLLQALRWPVGSEVLMSALTVPDMARIVRHHRLVPVPLDLDPHTLEPSLHDFQKAVRPATRAVVVAPLFGSRSSLSPILQASRDHNLLVIEDCAQAYRGPEFIGHPQADASLFSFGPIKTATALGGAVLRVTDPQLAACLRQLQDTYPEQPTLPYARRLLKYAGLKFVSQRHLYGLLFRARRLAGIDPDRWLNRIAENFGEGNLIDQLRWQPATALLALLTRRLQHYDPDRLRRRAALGRLLARRLRNVVTIPGRQAPDHSYWVFPVLAHDPDRLIAELRKYGFDATQRHSLAVIDAPPDGSGRNAPRVERILRNIVLVPMYPELPDSAIRRLAEVIWQQQDLAAAPTRIAPSPGDFL